MYYKKVYHLETYVNPEPGRLKDDIIGIIGTYENYQEAIEAQHQFYLNQNKDDWTCCRLKTEYQEVDLRTISSAVRATGS